MKKLKELLFRSLNGEEKSLWKLIDENEYDLRTIITTINEILGKDIGFNEEKKKFYLLRHFPFEYIDFRCGKCKGRGYEPKIFKQTLDDFNRITKDRPLPIAEYDQGIVAPYDLAIKAGFMYQRGDLAGKEILVLGDDDLFSIFIGLTKLPKRIVVLDIDRRILKFIKEISREHELNIQAIEQDLSKGFPDNIGKFDSFVSEPPESVLGLKIFLRCGIEGLKGIGSSGYFGLTRLESSWAKWRVVEKFLIDHNFVITDIIRDFSIYPERENEWDEFYNSYRMMHEIKVNVGLPDVDWYKSSLIRIEKVGEIDEECEDLYMDEETLATPKPFKGG